MSSLAGKTLFVTGGSRGIGLAIALRAARDGANVAIAAKTSEPHPKLEGTIHTAAAAIEAAGGKALPLVCDIRDDAQVEDAVAQTVARFGGIDICVNNASAISLTPIDATEMRRFDLMHGVNARGTFLVSKTCVPHLRKSANPHILMLSPPLDMKAKWFAGHVAYSMAKFGMSLVVLGLAKELEKDGIAVNALWPRTTIATQRQFRPAVLESELRLAPHQGYLLLPDGLPVARIGLTADHITRRGDPRQPAYVPGDPAGTLWSRVSEIAKGAEPDAKPGPV